MEMMKEARSSKGSGRKKLASMTIERAKNGGHIVTHSYTMPRTNEGMFPLGGAEATSKHSFGASEGTALVDHMVKHMGVSTGGSEKEAEDEPEGGYNKAQKEE